MNPSAGTVVLAVSLMLPASLGAQSIVTIAGGGTDEGRPALASGLVSPRGLAVDTFGNLYVSEIHKHRVRKVDAGSGTIATVAGGTFGSFGDNGPAAQAGLDNPAGLAVDVSGNLYISDGFRRRIRKVAAGTGIITTVTDRGAERFAVDASGNLYIPRPDEHLVVKVAAGSGIVTTVAGNGTGSFAGDNGPATAAGLSAPAAVGLDASGNLFIVDFGNRRIRRVDNATGIITTVAGNGSFTYSGDNGLATAAGLDTPIGVAIERSGNLVLLERNRIRRVDAATRVITTIVGNGSSGLSGDNGPALTAGLGLPGSVVLDSAGNLYIQDTGNHRIRKVTAATGVITTVVGGASGDDLQAASAVLNGVVAVAVDSLKNLYIADAGINRIRKVAAGTGVITTIAGGAGSFSGDNGPAIAAGIRPRGIAVDRFGSVYIADSSNLRVRKVDAVSGIITTFAGNGSNTFSGDNGPATAAGLSNPTGVGVDPSGNVYIADGFHQRIRKVAAGSGIITTVAGGGTGGDNGPATEAALGMDYSGIAVDGAGNIYIPEPGLHRVRRVDAATGIIRTVAGNGSGGFSGDGGPATAAALRHPQHVAVDGSTLYISDLLDNRIRRVDLASGIITTVAGNGSYGFSGDNGPATAAMLGSPYGVAVDASGTLYIADTQNERIRAVSRLSPRRRTVSPR